ncbi:hypothetical protein BFP78_15825 [Gaetbulibacter sp. 5U11]|nr:hypothetical protein BFP78_15825 [Gaetbulibacter sp. 5U11]
MWNRKPNKKTKPELNAASNKLRIAHLVGIEKNLRNKSLTEFTQTLENLKTELNRIKNNLNKNNEMPTPYKINC